MSPWLVLTTFIDNWLLGVTFIISCVLFILSFYKRQLLIQLLAIGFFIILLVWQYQTTKISNTYTFSSYEHDLQIQRMNMYPANQARLAYIVEAKPEVQLVRKFENNFFEILNPLHYFPNYYYYLALPFVIYGLFLFIGKQQNFLLSLAVIAVGTNSLLGVNGKYGPFLLFPFLTLGIFISLERIWCLIKRI